ncbi:MAG: hypothetical protein H7318_05505 [Oligoflexus sp.]|nr:hypothetical protein [Oligoflexus sp.]
MSRFLFVITTLLLWMGTETATAQVFTPSLSLFYFQDATKREDTNTASEKDSIKVKETYNFINLGVCYNLGGFCLGLKYLQGELETKTASTFVNTHSTAVFHGPGVTLGYSGPEGIVAHLSLLLGGKKDIEATNTTYTCKQCYIAELGYGFKVSSVRIGPLLGIYDFTYNKRELNGVTSRLHPDEGDKFIMPQVAVWVDL